MKGIFRMWGVMAFVLFWSLVALAGEMQCPDFSSFYCKSLHYTGEGMHYWYETGLMKITNIPYKELGCKKCHVRSCDKCHAVKKGEGMAFSIEKARADGNCINCHARIKASINFDRKVNALDVHFAAGMGCLDCHSARDIHGDGTMYQSMRQPGAVDTSCVKCHGKGKAPYEAKTASHRVHKDKVTCEACHQQSNMTCYNCHFSHFLETKQRKAIPMKSFILLINYQGKVTSGNVMAIVYKGKKFIAYVPNFTHSITSKGRRCGECHGNKAMRIIEEGKKVPVVSFEDGKVVSWKGVVPAVPDKLQWTFFDWDGQKWVPLETGAKEVVQFAAFGEPLTPAQLKKLSRGFGR